MPPTTLPAPLRLAPSFPFVGRTRELNALRALMPRASTEGGRVAFLAGGPGSGKSRLVRELADEVAGAGAAVLYGACDAVVATPYRPFTEALDHLLRQTDPAELRRDLGPAGGELVRLLPDLEARVGELDAPIVADVDTERHRLHVAVADLLAAVGRRSPLLLVLEDLHWADASALLLLRHLTRSRADIRMLLLATFRDTALDSNEQLAETLADVSRSEGVVRMRLPELTGDDVAEFVERTAGARASKELTDAIGVLTGGNAFLLIELWRELVETEALAVTGGGLQLAVPIEELGTPESVREVASQRLGRLAPETREVLELAAVVGGRFDLAVLREAAPTGEGELLDAVDEADRSGMIGPVSSRGLSYSFSHELVRRALYDRIAASRRAELHLAVALALERSTGGQRSRLLGLLAYHFGAAAPVGGAERAVEYNLLAAEAAADSLAFGNVVEYLQTAIELGIDDSQRELRALLELAGACHLAGRSVEALQAYSRVAELAREQGDAELFALAAVGFEEACWRPGITDAGAVELLEEATHGDGLGSELRVRLLGGLARALEFRGEPHAAAEARDRAIELARVGGDRPALGRVLAAAYWSQGTTSFDEIYEMLVEAHAIGDALGDDEIVAESLSWMVPARVALCDHDGAHAALARLHAAARRLNQPFLSHVAEHYTSALELCDGDLAAAEAAAARSHEWSRLLTGRDASGVYGIQMFSIRREQGRLAELGPVIRVLVSADRQGTWRPGLIAVLAELGMEDEARRELDLVRDAGLRSLRQSLWLPSLTYLADACAVLRDAELAAEVRAELLPYGGGNVMVGHLVSCYGAADRYLGVLAAVLGEWDEAEERFEAALELNQRLGARTWLAHTAYEYARMLLARRSSGDRARAGTLVGKAVSAAESVGLASLAKRAARLGPAEAVAFPDDLSPREVAILRMVARGLSNREVGAELVISEHTVANHVRSILRKTKSANRTEATAYAHRRGLVET